MTVTAVGDRIEIERVLALDRAHVWHPYSSVAAPPVYPVAGAAGVRLRLMDGRELLDGMSSWWAAIHGYAVPELTAAAHAQLAAVSHVMFGGLTHAPAAELAKLLVDITPAPLERVFFCDSGSVSVEVAVKMVLQYWRARGRAERRRLLTVRGGYHGDTFAAMSVCDPVGGMHHLFTDVLPRQLFAARPPDGFDLTAENPRIATALAEMESLLAASRDEVAAVILEPIVQGAGGMRFSSPAYLRGVRRLCDAYDVLLIADEIATGFGRTGRLFACEHAGISPDVLCLGKALTGGYLSMAATLCTRRVGEGVCAGEAGVLMHGPTYMANPLAAAVARSSVELLLGRDWAGDVARIESALRAGLAPAARLPGVAEVRVLGAIGVVESRRPIDVPRLTAELVARGVWLRPFRNLLYTMPAYVMADEDLRLLTGAMVEAAAGLSGDAVD
jgi:adenosylmethionine-8-amino-7-oxononanoate aminotransferase